LRTRIALPGVYGRMDHYGWDTKRGVLIVAALGNDGGCGLRVLQLGIGATRALAAFPACRLHCKGRRISSAVSGRAAMDRSAANRCFDLICFQKRLPAATAEIN
jgi:hypothetical protein